MSDEGERETTAGGRDEPKAGPARKRSESFARQFLIVLAVALFVFWIRLGADGLSATEGHRAVPGWEMMDSGDWLVPTLFGQPYLRKPPGMTWAVAGSSMVFGQTEFAARAVSAFASTVMALLAFAYSRRWFGPRYATAAGIAFAMTPWFWQAGRSAEIEALNNMFIQASVFVVVDRLVFGSRHVVRDLVPTLIAGIGIGGALLTKGPIGMVIVVAILTASCIVRRSWKPMVQPTVWLALVMGLACFGFWFYQAEEHMRQAELDVPVTQSVGAFLWAKGHIVEILTLGLVAFFSALPMSVALLFPFGRVAGREYEGEDDRPLRVVKTLAIGCGLSLAVLTAIGLDNTRYAMPAFVFVTPMVVYVLQGWADRFASRRRLTAHVLLLGKPAISLSVMFVILGAWVFVIEPRRDNRSGREAGIAIAEHIPDGSTILAHHLIEARPEVLWYAKRAAERDGKIITMQWVPRLVHRGIEPDDMTFFLLRTDGRFTENSGRTDLQELATGRVHTYTFGLFGK